MKHIYYIILSILVCTLALGCSTNQHPKNYHIYLAGDITDSLSAFYSIMPEQIIQLSELPKRPDQGCTIHFTTISDIRHTPVYVSKLMPSSRLDDNDIDRKRAIDNFTESVNDNLITIQQQSQERKQSFVIQGITKALNTLAESTVSDLKIAIIASDLAENTPTLSLFRKKDKQRITTSPDKIMEQLDSEYPLSSSVSGIRLYFLHHSTTENDANFSLMNRFLTDYYSRKGVVVTTIHSLDEITP